eukprot:7653961-Pyramimonas_sp.AAC.1
MQLIPSREGIPVECWVDADWADDKTDRISTSGGILKCTDCTVPSFSGERAIRAMIGSSRGLRTGITTRGVEGEDDAARDERQQQRASHREEARAREDEARGDALPGAAAVERARAMEFRQSLRSREPERHDDQADDQGET